MISLRPTNFESLSKGTINVCFEIFSKIAIEKVSQVKLNVSTLQLEVSPKDESYSNDDDKSERIHK